MWRRSGGREAGSNGPSRMVCVTVCEQAGPDNSAAAGKTPLVSSMVLPERPGSFPPLVIWIFGMLLLSGGINSRGDVWL